MVEVIVPTRNILVGEALDESMFRLDKRTRESLPLGALTDVGAIKNHYAKQALPVNLPITQGSTTTIHPASICPAPPPPGFRPVTISLSDPHYIDPYLSPGTLLEIILIREVGKKKKATIVASRAKLLSFNRVPSTNSRTVVFLLPLLDAEKVESAKTEGELSLILRVD
jgi:Flp pilus assembly protein CpaB